MCEEMTALHALPDMPAMPALHAMRSIKFSEGELSAVKFNEVQ